MLNNAGGGAALSTLGLIDKLAQRGVESSVACDDAGSPEERARLRDATDGRVLFTRMYWWNKKTRSLLWKRPLIEARQIWRTGWGRGSARKVADFAVKQKAELFHTSTILNPEGAIASRWLGLPHVWHLRELLGPGYAFELPYSGKRLGQYFAANCEKLIANSNRSASLVRDGMPPGLLEVVPNGIDLSRIQPGIRVRGNGPLVIAMVGNLTSRWKKHSVFVEAAALVKNRENVHFRVYGHKGGDNDPYVAELRQLTAKLGIADCFQLPGFVMDPAKIMAEIDILVHTSDRESFGRVIVEAMAAALPVVGVNGGGVAEIVEDGVTGLLASADSPEDLAAAMERLISDPALRDQLGAAGRKRAETLYDLDQCVGRIHEIYQAVIGSRPPVARIS